MESEKDNDQNEINTYITQEEVQTNKGLDISTFTIESPHTVDR